MERDDARRVRGAHRPGLPRQQAHAAADRGLRWPRGARARRHSRARRSRRSACRWSTWWSPSRAPSRPRSSSAHPRSHRADDVGAGRRRARLLGVAPGLRAGDRPLPRERVERGEPGQGVRAARPPLGPRSCRGARCRRSSRCTRSTTCRSSRSRCGRAATSDRLRPLGPELAQEHRRAAEATRRVEVIGGRAARRPRRARPRPHGGGRRDAGRGLDRALQAGVGRQDAGTAVRGQRRGRGSRSGRSSQARGRRTASWSRRPRRAARSTSRDVARVVDGPDETRDAVFFSPGPAARAERAAAGGELPAVTVAVAKRRAPTPPSSPTRVLAQGRGAAAAAHPGRRARRRHPQLRRDGPGQVERARRAPAARHAVGGGC